MFEIGWSMTSIVSCDRVRLVDAVTELHLASGDIGIVRNSWHVPNVAYEVEFNTGRSPLRILLLDLQIIHEEQDNRFEAKRFPEE